MEWISVLVRIVVILALAILGLLVLRLIARYVVRTTSRMEMDEDRREYITTIVRVLRWAADAVIVITALMMVLSNFVDITPLLAGVGVAGLAVGLAAQTLISDFISGLLILLENQYSIGDVIQVGGVSGKVEKMTLRTTWLRDVEGQLHIIPNGEIRLVSNRSWGWSQAVVEVGVAYEEDLGRALEVIGQAAEAVMRDEEVGPSVLEPPVVQGPIALGDWAVTVRVLVKTRPGEQLAVGRVLRRQILDACTREGVTLPYPRQEVLVRNE